MSTQSTRSSSSLDHEGQNEFTSSAQKVKCATAPAEAESKPSAIDRFRSLARSVQSQGRWTKALQTKIADEHSKEFQINQESGGSNVILSFNVNGKQIFVVYSKLSGRVVPQSCLFTILYQR